MELQLRGRVVPDRVVICAIADGLDAAGAAGAADAAGAAGALLVDLGAVSAGVVTAVRDRQPGMFICAAGPGREEADVTWDATVAARTGAGLLCGSLQAALASDIGRDCIVIAAAPAQAVALAAEGWNVLVNVDGTGSGDAASVTVAAVSAWAGARVVRARNIAPVRQAIDMVESIRGTRPPARSTRGLA